MKLNYVSKKRRVTVPNQILLTGLPFFLNTKDRPIDSFDF